MEYTKEALILCGLISGLVGLITGFIIGLWIEARQETENAKSKERRE